MWNYIFFFSLFSLSSRPEAAGIYKLRLPTRPSARLPAQSQPFSATKKKQNKMSVTALSL